MDGDLIYNAGFGNLYLRVSGIYLHRKVGKGWVVTTLDNIPSPIWNPLAKAQFDTMTPPLKAEGLLPENVEFSGDKPSETAS